MKKTALIAVAASAALALTACGSPAASTSSDATTAVTVGALPIAPTAVLHLGIEKGFFKEEKLDVKIETGQGGAALIPAVVAGSMQFGTGNAPSLLQARDKGLDVQAIASYTYDAEKGSHAILSKKDSPIKTPKDLAGKKIAINTLKSMGDLLAMELVAKNGGDPKSVTFVELPFPNMQAALESGQVDAVWTPEPFMTIIKKSGAQVVAYDGVETIKGHPTMMYFTSGNYIKSNPDTVAKMKRAINKAMDYAQQHPDEVRQTAVDKLKVDAALSKEMGLEDFGGPIRTEQVKAMGELMTKYGFISKAADVDGLLAGAKG